MRVIDKFKLYFNGSALSSAAEYITAPLLLSIYTVIFLYTHNIEILEIRQLAVPLLVAFFLAIFVLILFRIAFKNILTVSVAASGFLIIFWNYGLIYKLFSYFYGFSHWDIFRVILFVYVLFLFFLIGLREKINFENINKMLMAAGVFLIVFNLFYMIPGEIKKNRTVLSSGDSRISLGKDVRYGDYPDIYLLIFDEYASTATMKEEWGYDNSKFFEFLKNRGFFIAEKSKVNSLRTREVLAELFNLRHISAGKSEAELFTLYYDNYLFLYLGNRGYHITYLDGNYSSLRSVDIGKVNLLTYKDLIKTRVVYLDSFIQLIYSKTLLYPLDFLLGIEGKAFTDHYMGNLAFFDFLKNYESDDNIPEFILAHVMCPHWPYVFDRNGNLTDHRSHYYMLRGIPSGEIKQMYLEQYIYVTEEIKRIVSAIQADNPDAVIIIQSDHGPRREATGIRDEEHQYRVLNTVYFPDEDYSALYDNISPVNTLRVIFNKYFNKEYEMLEDR